jgi:hypothetical protein
VRHLLLLGDSLAFHGPQRPELLTEPRLYPNVAARALGAHVDVVARLGWTARDAWWALTRDPAVYSILVPRADAVVLGVGGMDQLPASIPTYLREGIAYLRPGPVRRAVRRVYSAAHPRVLRATDGRGLRQLPQRATDAYLSRCVRGIRLVRPQATVVAIGPAPFAGPYYPVTRTHRPAVEAARRWATEEGVPLLDVDPIVGPALARGDHNPDGMHWAWGTHAAVGDALAALLRSARAG